MRMWSINTWLIVICVAVFVVDGFLPYRWMPMDLTIMVADVDLSDLRVGTGEPTVTLSNPRTGKPIVGKQTVIAIQPDGGQVPVGFRELHYMPRLQSYLYFSTALGFQKFEFWRFIGFQFLHGSLSHLLFNMLGLYFFGPMVERYLGSKRYLAFYLLCGILGACMYLLLNLGGYIGTSVLGSTVQIPGLLFNSTATPLVGASAGVYGVLMAGAFLAPNAMVLLFFILPMRLRTLAYALVVLAFLTILFGGSNAGGEAGHLGGAIAGFYFIRHPKHLHGFFDVLGRADPTSHHYRTKGAAARGRAVTKPGARKHSTNTREVDRILDKISSQGLHSLTDKEKKILRKSSDRHG